MEDGFADGSRCPSAHEEISSGNLLTITDLLSFVPFSSMKVVFVFFTPFKRCRLGLIGDSISLGM